MRKPAIPPARAPPSNAPIPAPIATNRRFAESRKAPAPATSRPVKGERLLFCIGSAEAAWQAGRTGLRGAKAIGAGPSGVACISAPERAARHYQEGSGELPSVRGRLACPCHLARAHRRSGSRQFWLGDLAFGPHRREARSRQSQSSLIHQVPRLPAREELG